MLRAFIIIGLYIIKLIIIKMEPDLNFVDYMSTIRNALIEDTEKFEAARRQRELEAEQARILAEHRRQAEEAVLKGSVLAAEKERARLNDSCKERVVEFVARTLRDCPDRNEPEFIKIIFYGETYDIKAKPKPKLTFPDGILQLEPPDRLGLHPTEEFTRIDFEYRPAKYDVQLLKKFKELGIHVNSWRDDVLSWLTELFTGTVYTVSNELGRANRFYSDCRGDTWYIVISRKN